MASSTTPTYEFVLMGVSAMLQHQDDVEWADELTRWRGDPKNAKQKGQNSGDDRRPAFSWIGYLHHDGQHIAIPVMMLQSCLRKAGGRVTLQGQKTFKELSVSGLFFQTEYLKFTNDGKQIPIAPIQKLKDEPDFVQHVSAVRKMGFELYVKRAAVGAAKHVRVRPRFNKWKIEGVLEVMDQRITEEALKSIFREAQRVGLGDWRPGSPKSPGVFGMFESKIKRI